MAFRTRKLGGGGGMAPVGLKAVKLDESGEDAGAALATPLEAIWSTVTYGPRHLLVWGVIHTVLNTVLDLMPPILTSWVIDSAAGDPPLFVEWFVDVDDEWQLAGFFAVLTFLIFFFESLFEYLYKINLMRLAQIVQNDLRMDVYGVLQRRENHYFETRPLGDTLQSVSDDVNQLEHFLNDGISELVGIVVMLIFSNTIMFVVEWRLALVSNSVMPLVIYGSFMYNRAIGPRYRRVRDAGGELMARLETNISGISVIKSFTAEESERERVGRASRTYRDAAFEAVKLSAAYVPMIRMLIALAYSVVLMLALVYALRGEISAGDIAFFSLMSQRALWPLTRLGQTFTRAAQAGACAARTFLVLRTEPTILDPAQPVALPEARGGRALSFDDVSFGYGTGRGLVLSGFSLDVAPGTLLGVAGSTGSGKSTLAKLLQRFYDTNGGAIRFDGVDVRDVTMRELRSDVSYVSQDAYVFSGTIRDNIAYGSSTDATLGDVRRAAKAAHLDAFVRSLPDAYDTLVGERGVRLSGGERQRVSLARALLKRSAVVIFDEATSSLDSKTELFVSRNLNTILRGRTAIVIAHRLSTIRRADRIVVLDKGAVVEDGTHDSLVASGGKYASLWATQTGDFDHATGLLSDEDEDDGDDDGDDGNADGVTIEM